MDSPSRPVVVNSKNRSNTCLYTRMVEDVQKLNGWRVIGFATFEDFCREKLGKTLAEVSAIVAGVKILQSHRVHQPTRSDNVKAAAANTTGEVLPSGKVNQHTDPKVVRQFAGP